ncbi:MAG: metallophosphoesterase family protein [Ardenticatenaceae bacterium]|nr:metallophosphoesterase family protein [Ardenticatenaceae bacterium]MCB9446269.1 metallophosphoesterase family protein [Ardenticatenaceae bacterium]
MKLAIISDIHGNQIALEAVLADIKRVGVDQIICLGDIANVGPHPGQCIDIIRDLNCPVLQGNHELYLLGCFEDDAWRTSPIWAGMRWAREQLRPDQIDFIANLPLRYEIEGNGRARATFVHASPLTQYRGFMPHHDDTAIAERMNGLDDTTLFCGHTHVPLYRPWSNSWLVNTGALGMPIDGTPTAKYVIATQLQQEWHVQYRMIEYNLKQLMAEFEAVGLQEVGGKVTAVFRYQMLTGQPLGNYFFDEMNRLIQNEKLPAEQALAQVRLPDLVMGWCNGGAVKR